MLELTTTSLKDAAIKFAKLESEHNEKSLYGATDGKCIATYFEHKFNSYLENYYSFEKGNSSSGIDFPELNVDMKVTSIIQPQSSCPFRSARQKIYGLGYSLLVFVYQKDDDSVNQTTKLEILHTIFIDSSCTGDFQLTAAIHSILGNKGNLDDLVALFNDKNLPVDEITAIQLAEEILQNKPSIGYLTISNALQWRLQYSRIIEKAGIIPGIDRLL